MRKKKLALNTISSLILQVVTLVSGFILPRLIIGNYGSEVNGLVNSITQFLQFIAFLELGVGAIIQSALYEPLANNDNKAISEIVVSGQKFFSVIARILLIYVITLVIVYPHIVNQNFEWGYTASLIVILSISSFAQYYFGIVNSLLLRADQKGYINYFVSVFTIIFNTVISVVLLKNGFGIHVVRFSTSLIFLFRPVVLNLYVKKNYSIDRNVIYYTEPLKQKWNGIAQHVAAIVLENTDTVVLSVFSTLQNVSIYSVYHLVIYGVKRVFDTITNGVMSLLGELWAKKEIEKLKELFAYSEWVIHTMTVLLFGCVSVLICPFITVYMKGVSDIDYIVPEFALVLTIAHAVHCLRMPYNIMILAGNHYKPTQSNYIIAALLNLGISIVAVKLWGLIGVAIGTLTAMVYQTIWMALYISKNLVKWPFRSFIKQMFVDVVSFLIGFITTNRFVLFEKSYLSWIVLAIKTGIVWFIIICVINFIFYRRNIEQLLLKLRW